MSVLATRIQNIRAKSNLDKWETRPTKAGVFDLLKRDTDHPYSIISDELKRKAFSSIGSTLEIPVINYDASVTIGSSRTVTIADDENVSAMHPITFITYAFGFTQVPAALDNNEIDIQRDFEEKFIKNIIALSKVLDTAGATVLTAQKTQVFGDDLGFTPVANVVTSSTANEQKLVGAIPVIMESNDYDGDQLNVVGNRGFQYLISQMDEKSVYNSENKTIQYQGMDLSYSNRITNAGADKATFFALVPGSVGILTRLEREANRRTVSKTGHEWDWDMLPLLGIPCATYEYDSVGDQNLIAGAATTDLDRGLKKHYGFAVDVAMVPPYASALGTNASPIMKGAVTTA